MYHATRDNEVLRNNNQKLSNIVQRHNGTHQLSSDDILTDTSQEPADLPKPKKKSLWRRFLSSFHKKKKKEKTVPQIPAQETSVQTHRSVSPPVEDKHMESYNNTIFLPRSESGDNYNLKENIRLLKRTSHKSKTRDSTSRLHTSFSASNIHSLTDRVSRSSEDSAYRLPMGSIDFGDYPSYHRKFSYSDDGIVRL